MEQHLEGSYVPRSSLRRLELPRRRYLYLDNGSRELVWDDHCNTQVVRWSLREHGIVLAGPDPTSLVDPVFADQLRDEVLAVLPEWQAWANGLSMSRRAQSLLVLTYCRMLHTLAVGRVTSKREAGEWALGALDPKWAGLVRAALDDRPDTWRKVHEPADPEAVEQTLVFVDYATDEATACAS